MDDAVDPVRRYAINVQTGALMIALTTIGAIISIPVPVSPVPIVLQNMFIVLTGLIMSPAWAFLTVAVYLLMGAVGLPVFAGGSGGIAHFAGPTGGFLLAYPVAATLTALIARMGAHRTSPRGPLLVTALSVGFLAVYLIGVPWLAFILDLPMGAAIAAGALPFLPGDFVKAVILFLLVRALSKRLWHTWS
jgi:biotin transport system substrate-specific component